MQPSGTKTLTVPIVGGSSPARLTQANAKTPMRVIVRNSGGTLLMIAFDTNSLTDINQMGACFQLPAGASEVFVLAPGQPIIAAAVGGGGQATIAYSEAFPVGAWMGA